MLRYFHSHTLENKSSLPENPPAGFGFEVALLVGAGGGALVHPPKSSSAETVGAALVVEVGEGEPHPEPMSLAVIVSGTFIIDEEVCLLIGEVTSAVFQALPPHGSMALLESMLLTLAVLVGGDTGAGSLAGADRLKMEFTFSVFGRTVGGDVGVVVDMDEKRSKVLVEVAGGAAADFVDPIVAPTRLKSRPEEIEGFLACCGFGAESKNPPLLNGGEEIFEAVGGDLGALNDPRFENASCF